MSLKNRIKKRKFKMTMVSLSKKVRSSKLSKKLDQKTLTSKKSEILTAVPCPKYQNSSFKVAPQPNAAVAFDPYLKLRLSFTLP